MLEGLFGGLFDKEKATYETVQSALEKVSGELGEHTEGDPNLAFFPASFKDFFIMIRPMNAKFDHKYFICKYDEKGNPVKVREITLKEILSDGEEA